MAWATPDQLRPTQPQVGKREVARKAKEFSDLMNGGDKEFSKKLYRHLYAEEVVPVYLGAADSGSDYGYIVDHHHGAHALLDTYKKMIGKRALKGPLYDKKGRPMNIVLVKVEADMTHLSPTEFASYMKSEKHSYLKDWRRGTGDRTVIKNIEFSELPESLADMTNNPFRDLVGEEQHDGDLGRSSSDFSQFIDAEGLVKNNVVKWREIDLDASQKQWDRAIKKAKKFFASKKASGLPGDERSGSCEEFFKK